jgi:hypothetical protein
MGILVGCGLVNVRRIGLAGVGDRDRGGRISARRVVEMRF